VTCVAPRLLIVDDEPANTLLLRRLLEREELGDIEAAANGEEALDLVASWLPDVIMLDLNMPVMDGYEVLERLPAVVGEDGPPVIVLTGDAGSEARMRALELGASDFIVKPFDRIEVLLRVRNHLHTRRLHVDLQGVLRRRTEELVEARLEVLERLAVAAEFRDDETHEHTKRVGANAAALAAELDLPSDLIELIRLAAPLHDIGKIGVPDDILLKPGRLTEAEFAVIRQHVTIGGRILDSSPAPVLQLAHQIALAHHERFDGSGYLGMRGSDIPLAARLVTPVDVYDALTSRRPYKEPWPAERAVDHICAQRGVHFDPDITDAFVQAWRHGRLITFDSAGGVGDPVSASTPTGVPRARRR
jgi:putative two-component system response regulator